ncbi:MAG: helix-hairpin-helix domain-containing protein [Tessaracoccus sp.]|nr:helix-hairpin-helix domain-containing protein [Tessaracoccus sp.]
MERVDVEEVARARLAYISAGHGAIGGPRRAVAESAPEPPVGSAPASPDPIPPASETRPPRAGGRWHLPRGVTLQHVLVVALLLLSGVGVAVAALSRSSATEVPLAPIISTAVAATPPAPSPSPTPPRIRVHVTGAVVNPGVVALPEGAIAQDAIVAAGGLADDADPALLNLAAPLADGVQVVIGTKKEPLGELRGAAPGGNGHGGSAASGAGAALDLNMATADQLEALPGVGPVMASAILAWREENGRFTSVDELQEISGIGAKTLEKLRPLVKV